MTFLRPWFLLLILIPFLFKLFKEQIGAESPWRKVIDEKLLPYLLIHGSNATIKQRRFFKILLWILLSVAMAGPAWDKTDVPAHTYQPGTIIVLELSPAMTGENLKRAQQKIYDILDLLKGEQVGLVLYDRYGYTAGPLTFETDIIRNMVPYLDATVLPERKSDALVGFEQANRLFQNADIKEGRILFLTSGVFWDDDLAKTIRTYPHKIGILGIGPAEPHPIPQETGGFILGRNGQPLMVYFDPKKMEKVGSFEVMTPDDTDVQNLIDKTRPTPSETERLTNQNLTLWRDRGGVLVALLLPFFALLFRKSIVILFLLCFVQSAEASLWLRPDQEEYRLQMMGVDFYRRGNYTSAEGVFKKGKDVETLYNKGNALAFQQKIPEAIAAYKEALKIDSKHEDARYNKEYLEKEQEKQKEQQEKEKQEQKLKKEKEKLKQEQEQLNQEKQKLEQEKRELKLKQENQDRKKKKKDLDQKQRELEEKQKELEKKQQELDQKQKELEKEQRDLQKQEPKDNKPEEEPKKQDSEQKQQELDQKQQDLEKKQNPPPSQLSKPEPKNSENAPLLSKESSSSGAQKEDPYKQQGLNQAGSVFSSSDTEPKGEPKVEPLFDQESEKVLNQLPPDEDNVLRYRIRQQYNRYRRN